MASGGSAWGAAYSASAEVRLLDSPTAMLRNESAPVSASAAVGGGTFNTHAAPSALASVDPGGVHLTAIATAQVFSPGPVANIYSSADARGGFTDRFVLSAPGLPIGSTGTATVAFVVEGSPSFSGGPAAVPEGQGWGGAGSWRARFSLVQNGDGVVWEGNRSYTSDAASYITDGTANFGTVFLTLPVVFGGAPLDLSISGMVEARAGANSIIPGVPASLDASASMLLGNTIAWGGFTDLRDANGVVITNFDATSSDSGFNYAHAYAVPEPGACAVLLTGLGAGVSLRRKK